MQNNFFVFKRRAKTIDGGHRSDDNGVVTREQGLGAGMAEAVDFFVDHRFLLDIGVRIRHVRLWLIVIVITYKILDRILRKEFTKLVAELGGESFVVRDDESWFLDAFNHVRHCERFARSGDAE